MRVLFIVLALATAGVAAAQPPGPGHHPGPPHEVIADHATELGIATATVDAIRTLADEARPELDRLHQAARDAHESGDRDAIDGAMRALHEAERELMDDIEAELTEAQVDALHAVLPPPPDRRGAPPDEGRPPTPPSR